MNCIRLKAQITRQLGIAEMCAVVRLVEKIAVVRMVALIKCVRLQTLPAGSQADISISPLVGMAAG